MLLLTIMVTLDANNKENLVYWSVSPSSRLMINGTTNVNTFVCTTDYFKGDDLLVQRRNTTTGGMELSGELSVAVDDIDCHNRIMNHDLQNALQSKIYPDIKIEFFDLKEQGKNNKTKVMGWVEITLTGKKKRYPIECDLESSGSNGNILRGEQEIYFSDFGLIPPHKAFGMIKVRDKISVSFELILEKVAITEGPK
jgi:hypothetical protein